MDVLGIAKNLSDRLAYDNICVVVVVVVVGVVVATAQTSPALTSTSSP